jgi:hypothetical protein
MLCRLFTFTHRGKKEPLKAPLLAPHTAMAANAKAKTASPRNPIILVTCKPESPVTVRLANSSSSDSSAQLAKNSS